MGEKRVEGEKSRVGKEGGEERRRKRGVGEEGRELEGELRVWKKGKGARQNTKHLSLQGEDAASSHPCQGLPL